MERGGLGGEGGAREGEREGDIYTQRGNEKGRERDGGGGRDKREGRGVRGVRKRSRWILKHNHQFPCERSKTHTHTRLKRR